jgi:hypothetical protein
MRYWITATSGQKEDIENSSVEFHMTVIPKTHFLGKREAVPFNHRFSRQLLPISSRSNPTVVADINLRTI